MIDIIFSPVFKVGACDVCIKVMWRVFTPNKQTEVLRGKVLTIYFHIVQLKKVYRYVDKANVTKSFHLV